MAIAAQRKTTVFSLRLENDIEGLAPIRIVIQAIIAKVAQQLHLHIHDTSTDDRLTCCPVPAGNVAKRVNHGLFPFRRPYANDFLSLALLTPFSFTKLYPTTKHCLVIAGDGKMEPDHVGAYLKRNGPCPTREQNPKLSWSQCRKSAYSLRESAPASDACRHPCPLATNAPRSLDARALGGSIPAHTRNGPCPTREQNPKLSWSQ